MPIQMPEGVPLWPIEGVKRASRNPRTHTREQILELAAAMTEFGFTAPILVDENDQILAGHARLAAAQELELPEIPVLRLTHLSDTQKQAYLIADNRLAERAGWDTLMLGEELLALQQIGFDVGLAGFSDDDLAALEDGLPTVDVLGVDHAGTKPSNMRALKGGSRAVGLQFGEIMTTIPIEVYARVWSVAEARADQQVACVEILEAGLETLGVSELPETPEEPEEDSRAER